MKIRGSGILLHITSLPSPFGIGDLGPAAYRFVDFLKETHQSAWQVLPLNPTNSAHANSPYSSNSAFAGNPLLISPELLVETGLLFKKDLEGRKDPRQDRIDYGSVEGFKYGLLQNAFDRFQKTKKLEAEFETFCLHESYWLDSFALFVAIKKKFNDTIWGNWPWEYRDRAPEVMETIRKELRIEIKREKFFQFLFFRQWAALKRYANERGITLFGDIPIYINYDSADVWTNPELFKLNGEKKPEFVAGVPPDMFSETGQLWGNPVFDWEALKETGFLWWMKRVQHNLTLINLMRIDHFRGFVAYWEVPGHENTAVNGKWVTAPVYDFLKTLYKYFPNVPLIAEDLGVITPDVREIMNHFSIPGMRVLLFAFFENMPQSAYIPHNHIQESVVYTGTHDNNTVRGWFEKEASGEDKKRVFEYIGREVAAEEVAWEVVRLAMMSVANLVIIPMQDILCLGEEARMNKPGTLEGNWEWRLSEKHMTDKLKTDLAAITRTYGRA
jgi:4-alpha-glucanotransferase